MQYFIPFVLFSILISITFAIQCYKCGGRGTNGKGCDKPSIVSCPKWVIRCKTFYRGGKALGSDCYEGMSVAACYQRGGPKGRLSVCNPVGGKPCNDPKLPECRVEDIHKCNFCNEKAGQSCKNPTIEFCKNGQESCYVNFENNFGVKAGCLAVEQPLGCHKNGSNAKFLVCKNLEGGRLCNNPGHPC